MDTRTHFDEAKVERYIPWFIALVVSIAASGLIFAGITGEAEWVSKSGKVMVAASFLFTYLQFHYESKFSDRFSWTSDHIGKLIREKGVSKEEAESVAFEAITALKTRFEETRRKVLLCALAAAGIGELVAAFGDVVFAAFRTI